MSDFLKKLFGTAEPMTSYNPYENGANPATTPQDKSRPRVFDPALKNYTNGYRAGDPTIDDPKVIQKWRDTRRFAIEHVLRLIYESDWTKNLVLRGSVPMSYWFADKAREPHDIDWVFYPHSVEITDSRVNEFYAFIRSVIEEQPEGPGFKFDHNKIATDGIWTYERADGRRIRIPWTAEGMPEGEVQMDIVYGERLLEDPIDIVIPTLEGRYQFMAASKELSLAWKILWIATDDYPQGKDIYDAAILSNECNLSADLLRNVLESSPDYRSGRSLLPPVEEVDWEAFQTEYPDIQGHALDWLTMLRTNLADTFAEV